MGKFVHWIGNRKELQNPFLTYFLFLRDEIYNLYISYIGSGNHPKNGFWRVGVLNAVLSWNETKFKSLLREAFDGWSETYEPARGSGVGYPDLQFLVEGRILPIEVKVGWMAGEVLKSKIIRPSQIGWHDRFAKAGGKALVVICIKEGKSEWKAWALKNNRRETTAKWRQGWLLKDCKLFAANGVINADILRW
jgi:hypothetical protein